MIIIIIPYSKNGEEGFSSHDDELFHKGGIVVMGDGFLFLSFFFFLSSHSSYPAGVVRWLDLGKRDSA